MFTKREEDVLNLIAKGFTNKEIAQNLVVSEHTVKAHLESIYKKLGVHNRVQAVLRLVKTE